MAVPFRIVLGLVVTASSLTFVVPVEAGQLDTCAQRVIRDWYSGGKVDGVYPLPCYRAAMRTLPEDVRQYSDANREIARALAYARRGLGDPGPDAAVSGPASSGRAATPSGSERRHAEPTSADSTRVDPPTPTRPDPDRAVSLASAASTTDGAGVPLPLVVLGTLAAMLFAAAATAALASRRRRRGSPADR